MNTLEILEAARAKIAQGWCKGAYAIDADGAVTPPLNPKACRWCARGAIGADDRPAMRLLVEAAGSYGTWWELAEAIIDHNDSLKSQTEALEWFDRAIALAKERAE